MNTRPQLLCAPVSNDFSTSGIRIDGSSIGANVIAPVSATIVVVIGAAGLIGNLAINDRLLSVLPGLATMKVNTALCLMVCGVALWLRARDDSQGRGNRIADVGALFGLSIALATLMEYFLLVDLGVDELLLRDPVPNLSVPGRMGINTAFSIALVCVALLLIRNSRRRIAAEIAALLAGLIAIITLVGYLFSSTTLTRIASYTPMALHTSIALSILVIGILCLRRQKETGIYAFVNLSRNVVVPAMILFILLLVGTAWFWYQLQADIQGVQVTDATPLQLQIVSVLVLFSGVVVSTTIVALILALAKARDVATAKSQLAAIVESSDDAIISQSMDGIITSWNPGAQRLFGYPAREVIGKPMSMVIPADRQHEEGEILARITRGERIEHFETERIAKDGRLLSIAATISPIVDSLGRVRGVSKIARDIGERKRFIAALESSNLELQRFAYVASHDLQTPLRSIVSFAELLQRALAGKVDEEAADWLRRVVTSGEQMQSLIQDLLAYGRIDSQQRVLQPVDLNKIFDSAKELLFAVFQESGAEVSRGELPVVMGDPSQLLQLLQNLIGNGVKYRDMSQDKKPKVEVSAALVAGQQVIYVADNGIGIDSKYHDKIFELFQRLHSTSRYAGTGIGLAVCRRIVEHLGGRIWVESELGRGSRFCFSLPTTSTRS